MKCSRDHAKHFNAHISTLYLVHFKTDPFLFMLLLQLPIILRYSFTFFFLKKCKSRERIVESGHRPSLPWPWPPRESGAQRAVALPVYWNTTETRSTPDFGFQQVVYYIPSATTSTPGQAGWLLNSFCLRPPRTSVQIRGRSPELGLG